MSVGHSPPPRPTSDAEAVLADRRRPGRRDVHPELVPLLRGQGAPPPPDDQLLEFDEPDQLSAARGFALGSLLSAPIWVGIVYLGRWLLS